MNKFSIIIPTYNSIKYIQQCIDSVLEQTYPNFEIIVIDSGSTDNTVSFIENIKSDKIKIYKTEKRLSITENWDRIKAIPRKEFMTILGHDDCFKKNFLEEISKLIDQYPKAVLYQTHFNYINEKGEILRHCTTMEKEYNLDLFFKNIAIIDIMATGFVLRTKDYDNAGGISLYPNLLFADLEFLIKILQKGLLMVSSSNCFSFRKHQSTTNTTPTDIYVQAFSEFVKFLLNEKNIGQIVHQPRVQQSIALFIEKNCQGMVYKNLQEENNKIQVKDIVQICQNAVNQLTTNFSDQYLQKKPKIYLAIQISNFKLLKMGYIWFKKMYSKPIL